MSHWVCASNSPLLYTIFSSFFFFFFNDTATTEIYTLSLHDALPICAASRPMQNSAAETIKKIDSVTGLCPPDRKSTRLNSSHSQISYAVFCLKKKKSYKLLPTAYYLQFYLELTSR